MPKYLALIASIIKSNFSHKKTINLDGRCYFLSTPKYELYKLECKYIPSKWYPYF